ncbi:MULTISPECIES: TonB-dependent receptor domain-containing protein [unclassified Azospirillum]|uniref:TonB-dependent receptor domain-containing protein n=1 Tax=unclassified Azospirillum TaxID=2630922 RepID=UPI00190E7AA9|nr:MULTISPECIES: TonB-dependent receptor [unclassified Azospirillum]
MMKGRNRLLLLSTCALSLLAVTASAQQAADKKGSDTELSLTEIVVTGTRIARPNATAAAPIQSVTAAEIQAQAAVNIEEVLNRLPQISPDNQASYQDSDGRQRIKLRNLGFERTLVLVDGKRLGTMNGQDAGMIPTALLERVDVLTGGASSVYGSDAVAGVVNFVMKKKFEGVQVNANHNFYYHKNKPTLVSDVANQYGFTPATGTNKDGGRADISVAAGTGLFEDRLHIAGFVDYREASLVKYSSRETSACQITESTKDGPLGCTTSTYSPAGYISPRGGSNNGSVFLNNPNGSRTFVPSSTAPGFATNPYDGYPFQRENKRWNAGGFATFDLTDSAEIYVDAMMFHDRTSNPYPARVYSYTVYGSTPYQVNCNNPFMSATQAQSVCGSSAGTASFMPLEVRYRFNDLPHVEDVYVNKGHRITGGVRGKFADVWSYDVGGVYARNRQDSTGGNLPDFDKINRSLNVVNVNGTPTCVSKINGSDPDCVPFDAFRANNNDAALFDYLLTRPSGTSSNIGTLGNVLANVQGDLGAYGVTSPWANEGLAVAFGAEFRHDQLKTFADSIYRTENGGTDRTLNQHVWEGNLEVQAPLVQEKPGVELLQLNGGYRLSKYNSNPDSFSTWKGESLYAPVEDITFRASINKAQRAPTVVEIAQAENFEYRTQGGLENDFCASTPRQVQDPNDPTKMITVYDSPKASQAVCAATGLAPSLYGSRDLSCPDNACTVRLGGFTVDPETAYTKTIGVVLKPRFAKGLVVSVDRFMIDLNDSIGFNYDDYFWKGCLQTGQEFFCSKFVRNANGTLYSAASTNPTTGFIRGGTTNYYKSKSHGWDIQAQYRLDLEDLNLQEAGFIDWSFAGSLTTLAGGQDSPILPKYNCAGYYGGPCGQLIPKWTHGLRGTYNSEDGNFTASLNWRYVGVMNNVSNSGKPELGWTQAGERSTFYRIPAYNYFDLAFSYRVQENYTFRLAANNLFDKRPPILPNSYSYGLSRNNTLSGRYDSLGRQIAMGLTINF